MIKIAPSILAADFANLKDEIKKVEISGADLLHLDIMDGHFVPNITIGMPVVKCIRKYTRLPFDVHLMIESPEKYIEAFADAGADIITVHCEATKHLHRSIQMIKNCDKKACVALNPATPLDMIDYVIGDVDMVLIMTVNPGYGGQKYIPAMTDKILDLRDKIFSTGRDIDIEVDGGISLENISEVIDAGANVIVAGSYIYKSKDIAATIDAMKSVAYNI